MSPAPLPLPNALNALTCDLPLRQTSNGDETRIHFFTDEAAFESWITDQPDSLKNWVNTHKFQIAPNHALIVPASDGTPECVLAAYIGMPTLYSSAYLARKLPTGDYRLADMDGAPIDAMTATDIAIAWGLASYNFDALKSEKEPAETFLSLPDNVNAEAVTNQIRAVWLTRDLVNLPTNHMGPADLAAAASGIAEQFDAAITVTDDQAVVAAEYPAIYAVGKGSESNPRLIDMSWGKEGAPKITLVGKGVCFDTGGLDLKPSSAMLNMKKDMGGSAQALGLAYLIMANELPVRLRVLIPAVENSVSGRAFRPKDIIRTRAGLSVEIGNTDAEGRLVLADALDVADKENPELLVDFATLTGAARVALGPDLPAMMTNDDALADALATSGLACGDPVWRLPLWEPYASGLDSKIADTSNVTTGGFAGSITAGLFLQKFVPNTLAWVHFDVFAWSPSGKPGKPEGGEAQAMRAVFHYLDQRYGETGT